MGKQRLDQLVFSRQLAPSRERAKALIMEGCVFLNGVREDKPGAAFDLEKIRTLEVRGEALPYVSRGGLKLEKALEVFCLSPAGCVCLDIGASTGGFTDCLLQHGAKKVYAVDTGYNQLDYRLRTDARVICMERTNFRYLTPDALQEPVAFACADVSFISLDKILKPAHAMLCPDAPFVCLVKPQFEAGRDKVGKHGIVRDRRVQEEVLVYIASCAAEAGFAPADLTYSPIQGQTGNTEFLLCLRKKAETAGEDSFVETLRIGDVVEAAGAAFGRKGR